MVNNDGDLWLQVENTIRQLQVTKNIWRTLPSSDDTWITCFSADSERFIKGIGIHKIQVIIEDKSTSTIDANQTNETSLFIKWSELAKFEENLKTNGNHQRIKKIINGNANPKGGIVIQSLRNGSWQNLEDSTAIPTPPTAMALDNNNLWVGGEGYLALVDLRECKVLKYCRIQAASVNRIQIGGGYVWAQYDRHLYRAPLSELQ